MPKGVDHVIGCVAAIAGIAGAKIFDAERR